MESRPSKGRGGSWKRGGNSSDSSGGEHRSRGRGDHHRGRGKRDHHRGRGRGGSDAAEVHLGDQDEGATFQEEDDRTEGFSRRKLESNWGRYEESERQEPDGDMPTQRGVDYHVLLESAGDSFTQFQFSEEKDWEMDSITSQMYAAFLDLPALAESLQQLPLHQRLNLEAELVQGATPRELPPLSLKTATVTPPSGASTTNQKVPAAPRPVLASGSQVSSNTAAAQLVEDDDELDQLLSLQKLVLGVSGNQPVTDVESLVPEKECEEVKKTEEAKDDTNHKSVPVRKEVTEEDLEDWLDSMIS